MSSRQRICFPVYNVFLNDASGSANRLAGESLNVGTVLKNRVGIFMKIKLEETYAPLANLIT
jgi:hypothetical protein